MSTAADHLALAARVIGRALDMMEDDPGRACLALRATVRPPARLVSRG